ATRQGRRDLGWQVGARTDPALDHELNVRRGKQRRVAPPMINRWADRDVRNVRRQPMDGVGRVAGAGDLDRKTIATDTGRVDERLDTLRIAEVARVKKSNWSTVGVRGARCDQVEVGPVVDRVDPRRIGPAVDEVLAEAGTARDDRVAGTHCGLLESLRGGENPSRTRADADGLSS